MNTVIFGVVAAPTIIGIVTILRIAGLPSHLAPLADLLLGIAGGFASVVSGAIPAGPPGQQVVQAIVIGIGIGLAASGVYQAPYQAAKIIAAVKSSDSPAPQPPAPVPTP